MIYISKQFETIGAGLSTFGLAGAGAGNTKDTFIYKCPCIECKNGTSDLRIDRSIEIMDMDPDNSQDTHEYSFDDTVCDEENNDYYNTDTDSEDNED
jgi:hypothetical protein